MKGFTKGMKGMMSSAFTGKPAAPAVPDSCNSTPVPGNDGIPNHMSSSGLWEDDSELLAEPTTAMAAEQVYRMYHFVAVCLFFRSFFNPAAMFLRVHNSNAKALLTVWG